MTFISTYLKGAYGLRNSFWFGLVLGGLLLGTLTHSIEGLSWAFFTQGQTISAVILLSLTIIFRMAIMALAVGVMFASFYKRDPRLKGWLACFVAGIVMIGAVAQIIETTTSIRTGGQSYGWPYGRDHRQFSHQNELAFWADRLLARSQMAAIEVKIITTQGAQSQPDLARSPDNESGNETDIPDLTELLDNTVILEEICNAGPFDRLTSISHLLITVTRIDGERRQLTLNPSDCPPRR